MFEVDYKITDFFFDRLAVQDKLAAKELRAMSRIGAFIMRGARQSIKRRKSSSAPGSIPHAHSTDKVATLKNILFGFDPSSRSVVVGPVKLGRIARRSFFLSKSKPKRDQKGRIAKDAIGVWVSDIQPTKPVTSLTEFGGTATAKIDGKNSTLHYPARPFMGPALERERTNVKLIEAWKEIL